jgi:hypothetical protein
MLNIKMIHCKPPNISPPEYKRPLCKPTTCSNAHLIPNISPPPNISPLNISPLVYHYCLSLLPLLITIITNTKDRPCTITNILAGRWVRDWTHRWWLEVSRTYRAKRGGFGKLPATRGASNPGLTEPASMFGFYHMPFR